MSNAHLEDAFLYGTDFKNVNLSRAGLSFVDMRNTNLSDADASGANFYGANLKGANLEGANLEGANLEGANLEDTILDPKNERKENHGYKNQDEDKKRNTDKKDQGKLNYYQILGLDSNATQEEIKVRYRELAIKFHPDKEKSSLSDEMMKQINEAYSILGDVIKRKQYDLAY